MEIQEGGRWLKKRIVNTEIAEMTTVLKVLADQENASGCPGGAHDESIAKRNPSLGGD
jgi:hypothetical protein